MSTIKIVKKSRNRSFYKILASMVIPLALQNFMSSAVNAADAVMLGFVEQDALSAVSLAGQIYFVFNLFIAVVTTSTTILAAQYWGKGERDTVEQVLAFALKLAFAVGLIFFAASAFFPALLMRFFTTDETLIAYGADYLRIMSFSFPLVSFSQVYLCIMKNSGKTAKSTVIGSSAMVLNILLNSVLIFGLLGMPALGIAGAAIASVLSRVVEAVWALTESFREGRIKIRGRYLRGIQKILRGDYIKNAVPVFLNYMVWGVGFTMYSVIMGHLGSDAVAANSIANIAKNLVICICLGIGTAGGILVGNELGRGDIKKGIEVGGKITRLSVISGIISGLVLLCLTPLITNFADLSETARGYLQGMLLMCCYYVIGKSINSTTIGGIFCAGGDAKFGFYIDSIVMWVIMVPLGFLAAFVWHLPVLAVYFILSLDEFIKLPVVFFHYRKYRWAKDLTREHH